MSPQDFSVVIIGQDPYPREESAVGIAFYDGMIKEWKNRLSPSFQNIVKAALANRNWMKPGGNIKDMRAAINKHKMVSPVDWFESNPNFRSPSLLIAITQLIHLWSLSLCRVLYSSSPPIPSPLLTLPSAPSIKASAGSTQA
eukprot:TRINITY_DN6320_c0_g2_i2.p1 TRINITY_DN6320_c0_g2~~TRINITY_DN6320_c0_g2_i2.p1  ORF type:complete len:142 (-),score=23.23 TRINITY_DN6320_c0_g2_i2:177-602(-)